MYEIFEHTADLGLRVRAESLEQLFVDAARGLFSMVVADLETVRATEERQWTLATALGESVDPARHALEHEVKAITYHALRVERLGDEWLAEVIVDI